MYRLRLLGGISLEGPHGPMSGPVMQQKRLALLAMAAASREKGLSREKLVGYLWPETDEERARHRLADSLYVIRRELGEDAVLASGEMLRLNPEAVWTDLCELEYALQRGEPGAAVELYGGPFLEGFYLSEAPELERWVESERERLAGLYARALEALALKAEDEGEYREAVEWWKRLATQDPYDSRLAVRLMEALAAAGDVPNALQHARAHEVLLREEFEVEPAPEVLEAAERLRRQHSSAEAVVAEPLEQPESRPEREAGATVLEGAGIRGLLHEVRRRSFWEVLLVYVAGAWACYELIQTITSRLDLPYWFPALAAVLFLLILPFAVATPLVREAAAPVAVPARAEAEVADEAACGRAEAAWRHRLQRWRRAGLSFLGALAVWVTVVTGWLVFGGSAAETRAVAEDRPSVAVLPFVNRSERPEDDYFTDGMHDQILMQLSGISGLSLRGHTSVMQYRDSPKNLRQIGEELNARYLLEGAVLRAGETVRINVQLIDAQRDEHLWAETYDRELSIGNLLWVQTEVAKRVAESLQATLTPEELQRIEAVPTENFEAYDYYLRGNSYLDRAFDEPDNLHMGAQLYESAVESDSTFALAYAALSTSHSNLYHYHFDRTEERLLRAKADADRALRLDPDMAEAHLALGYYHYYGFRDYERALDEFAIARAVRPSSADIIEAQGYIERRKGQWEAAAMSLEQALERDPRSMYIAANLAQTYLFMRKYPEVVRYADRVISLQPREPGGYMFKAAAYLCWDGDVARAENVFAEASRHVDRSELYYYLASRIHRWRILRILAADPSELDRGLNPDNPYYFIAKAALSQVSDRLDLARAYYDSARVLLETASKNRLSDGRYHSVLGIVYAGLGRYEDAIRLAEEAVEMLPVGKDALYGPYWVANLAEVHLMAGNHEEAIDQLERLLSLPAVESIRLLQVDPIWDPLRDHPRFQALLARYERY